MLWIRGVLFTALVPWTVAVYVPSLIRAHDSAWTELGAGWAFVAMGASLYLFSLLQFLEAGGTPSIYFTRPLRFVLGEEPGRVVYRGLYGATRNPMYIGVVLTVLGQGLALGSPGVIGYGLMLSLVFHCVVVCLEEPHLIQEHGEAYLDYCKRVPRWLGKVG